MFSSMISLGGNQIWSPIYGHFAKVSLRQRLFYAKTVLRRFSFEALLIWPFFLLQFRLICRTACVSLDEGSVGDVHNESFANYISSGQLEICDAKFLCTVNQFADHNSTQFSVSFGFMERVQVRDEWL